MSETWKLLWKGHHALDVVGVEYNEPNYTGRYEVVTEYEVLARFVADSGTKEGRASLAMMLNTFGEFMEDLYWTAIAPDGAELRIRAPSFTAEGHRASWRMDFWRIAFGRSYRFMSLGEAREFLRHYAVLDYSAIPIYDEAGNQTGTTWKDTQPVRYEDEQPSWFNADGEEEPFLFAMSVFEREATEADLPLLMSVRVWDPALWRRRWGEVLRARYTNDQLIRAAIEHIRERAASGDLRLIRQFIDVLNEEALCQDNTAQILRETHELYPLDEEVPMSVIWTATAEDLPWLRARRDISEDEFTIELIDEAIARIQGQQDG